MTLSARRGREEQRVGQRDGDGRVDRVGHHRGVGEGGEARAVGAVGGGGAVERPHRAFGELPAAHGGDARHGELAGELGARRRAGGCGAWRVVAWRRGVRPGRDGRRSAAPRGRPAWCGWARRGVAWGVGAAGPTRVVRLGRRGRGPSVPVGVPGGPLGSAVGRGPGSGGVDAGRGGGARSRVGRERRRRGRRRPLPRGTAVGRRVVVGVVVPGVATAGRVRVGRFRAGAGRGLRCRTGSGRRLLGRPGRRGVVDPRPAGAGSGRSEAPHPTILTHRSAQPGKPGLSRPGPRSAP